MFKWLKSKKGFALAEMLVVTFVLILVTAASYSALKGSIKTTTGTQVNTITNISSGGF